jgi:hypothetical protein
MKDFREYKTTRLHPIREDYTTYYFYHKGESVKIEPNGPNKKDLIDYYHNKGWIKERHFDEEAYKEALEYFREGEREVEREFKKDLFEKLGIEDNPKKDKLYDKAYEMGHSGGFTEIYNYAVDLVELIEE